MHAITIRQLEVFVAIANLNSVRLAADHLHLSQPAISMALAELERQLNNPLFDRTRGRLQINQNGIEQLPIAREILQRLNDMQNHSPDESMELIGELHIGASNTVGNYLAGDLLGNMAAKHKAISLLLTVDNTHAISKKLVDYQLDIACVEGPVNHPAIKSITWRKDKLVVCCAPSNPLASKKNINPKDFKDAKWILREPGSATRSQTEQLLTALPPGEIFLELGQIEAIKQAVIGGLGIACLPEVATYDAVATGKLTVLDTPFLKLERNLSILLHRTKYQAKLINEFLRSLDIRYD